MGNLAKHPASTVQILGAEKALFKALKTKHDTPKYGLIYHAQLVGQASSKMKGKLLRLLWRHVLMLSARKPIQILALSIGPRLSPELDGWKEEQSPKFLELSQQQIAYAQKYMQEFGYGKG